MREQLIKYFSDEDRNEALNLYEKYILAKEKEITTFGRNFYSPNIWKWFEENFESKNFKIEINGLFEDSERRMISFNNIYEVPFPMKLIKIKNTSKFSNLTHRDFLGAVLGLGIDRNKIGDLLVKDDTCYLPVHEEIVDFILYSLEKVGRATCEVSQVEEYEDLPKVNFKEEIILISSLRIDGLVSKLANVSRGKAQILVEQGGILINYVKTKDKSHEIKENDRITVKGVGKFILGNIVGNSKSGKLKVSIKKYT